MKKLRPPLAAALAFCVLGSAAAPARAASLATDFGGMSQWLSHEMAQGLAFNAGSNFDPPREVKGYYLQPDLSFGAGRMPLDKRDFPVLQTQALQDEGGAALFPNSVLFPNLALHLRMGLPWRGDVYLRLADATTPPGYKISPTMTAKVQTNSFGGGIRQHFFGHDDLPLLTVGAHYNHVQGSTRLRGVFNTNTNGISVDDDFIGNIDWSINSFGLTAIVAKTYGSWTPFVGMGYNYATGSVRATLGLHPHSFLVNGGKDILGEGSDHPEQSQGREIFGASYDRPTWSVFGNGELKALGSLQYRSFIAQIGVALPFDIGRGPKVFYKKLPGGATPKSLRKKDRFLDDEPAPEPKPSKKRARPRPAPSENAAPEMIFLK